MILEGGLLTVSLEQLLPELGAFGRHQHLAEAEQARKVMSVASEAAGEGDDRGVELPAAAFEFAELGPGLGLIEGLHGRSHFDHRPIEFAELAQSQAVPVSTVDVGGIQRRAATEVVRRFARRPSTDGELSEQAMPRSVVRMQLDRPAKRSSGAVRVTGFT